MVWFIRFGHVLAGATWLGGYVALAVVLVPLLRRQRSEHLVQLALVAVRVITYVGALTIGFGLVLITRTRGFANLLHGEWGALVIASFVVAIVLMGVGDGALRPALRRLAANGDGSAAQRWAWTGLGLTVLAIGMMTRTIYARS